MMTLLIRLNVVVRFIRQEGVAPVLWRIVSMITGAIYRADHAYLLTSSVDQSERQVPSHVDVRIHRLAQTDLERLANIAYRSRDEIRRRLCAKQTCLIAEKGECIVHWSWLTSQPEYAREVEKLLRFAPEERYIYDCWTLRSARGHGIYPAVLARAMECVRADGARWLLALVEAENTSSLRAFEKAGFQVREEIWLWRVLWFRRHRLTRRASQ
jgi:GNAT superfamily N-acetyltransferase